MPAIPPTTPLMEQYEGVKSRYPGHLVLFRVGDFYETFGDDAKLLSKELEVVLTARAPDGRGERTPMAGVPHHAVESYLGRLVAKGYKVALCDQVEDARLARGLVRREVTRVVTPGTVVEDRILGGPDHNFLTVARLEASEPGSFAAVDVSTGEWFHGRADAPGPEGLAATLATFRPREILFAGVDFEAEKRLSSTLTREFPSARVEKAPPAIAESQLPPTLHSDSGVSDAERLADRHLAAYVAATQPRLLAHLEIVPRGPGDRLVLDAKTLRHLEVNRPMNPDDPGGPTLLDLMDQTVTAPGRRTLSFWLSNPLADAAAIERRLDAVEALLRRGVELDVFRRLLSPVGDLARIASRLAGRRIRPSEVGALRDSLRSLTRVHDWLAGSWPGGLLAVLTDEVAPIPELLPTLEKALSEVLPPAVDDHGIFRTGYDSTLDELGRTEEKALEELSALERQEQLATGIRGLKIGYNQVFGYYFEVTKSNLTRVPAHFHRKQTLAGGERFISDQLAALETRILTAQEGAGERGAVLWESLLEHLDEFVTPLHRLSRSLGQLDALASFAKLAHSRGYVRPEVDESTSLIVREGRHPVLDQLLPSEFVPNDTELDVEGPRLVVLTGPNMSGKSTYMRQVGLLVLLAQVGSFVPAKYARVGVVRSLFTRMGFTDSIGRGKSSFLVEMTEVADILRTADDRSLVLLDEVGRGTSTFDGLALAWGTLRYLHDQSRSRTLIATHYHQLTELIGSLAHASNAHLAVREEETGLVFLHRLVPGSTDRSYGIHVARSSGVPPLVVTEAEHLLRRLEEERLVPPARRKGRRGSAPGYTQAVLLSTESTASASAVEREFRALDTDAMTSDEIVRWVERMRAKVLLAGPRPKP